MNEEVVSWGDLFTKAKESLSSAGVEAADIEARWIVEKASGYEGSEFIAGLEKPATALGVTHLKKILARRLGGEPLQYSLGSWGFRNLDLFVDKRVLIPRPETERLVDIAISLLMKSTGNADKLVADLGTGSGAVGLSIADECSDAEVILVDNSEDALQVAAANLAGLGNNARKVRILQSSWFEAFPEELQQSFSLIVSNPPYIANGEDLPVEVLHWEPHIALYAGVKGTEHIETILTEARRWLKQNGNVAIEMAPHQIDLMSAKAEKIGYSNIEVHNDLSQRPRVMSCTWK